MSGLITLVNDNHVDSYLKEMFCVCILCILWFDFKQSTQNCKVPAENVYHALLFSVLLGERDD